VRVEPTALAGVTIVEPIVRLDSRGSFHESWQMERYAAAGLPTRWAQDNVSHSRRGVLRGLHFQHPGGQGKLVSALVGEILDVAVDVRTDSPTFGRSVSVMLSSAEHRQLYVPPGFAHGFLVLSDEAVVHYKCTELYQPAHEHTLAWDDPALGISWPIERPVQSPKDAAGRRLEELRPVLPAYAGP
jgi:dTDP-4-dehydrorhamnose 3,5-epimerase